MLAVQVLVAAAASHSKGSEAGARTVFTLKDTGSFHYATLLVI